MKNYENKKGKCLSAVLTAAVLVSAVLLNAVLLSACALPAEERKTDNGPGAGGSWYFDAFTVALNNHFNLFDDEFASPEQLAEISSVDVYYAENESGGTNAYFSFNGGPFEQLLPSYICEETYYEMRTALLKRDGVSDEDIAALLADDFAEDIYKTYAVKENPYTVKWEAFYCEKSLKAPGLKEEEKAQILALFPKTAETDIYIFDPYVTEKEQVYLFEVGTAAGFFSGTSTSEEAVRASVGCRPELDGVSLTFHEAGTWDHDEWFPAIRPETALDFAGWLG